MNKDFVNINNPSIDEIEILMFSLGDDKIFGINVLNIRELLIAPNNITRVPRTSIEARGMISLRDIFLPVFSLIDMLNLNIDTNIENKMMIVTSEKYTFAILINEIIGLEKINKSEVSINNITSIAKINDTRLVNLINVEAIVKKYT